MKTIWGASQHTKKIADGILSVETASHGGMILSHSRNAELQIVLGVSREDCSYEEVCNYHLVVLAFPKDFSGEMVYNAFNFVTNFPQYLRPQIPENYWLTVQGREVQKRAADFWALHQYHFRIGGMSFGPNTPRGMEEVRLFNTRKFRHVITVLMPPPLKNYYTIAELKALKAK
jgi:hypothetical protein